MTDSTQDRRRGRLPRGRAARRAGGGFLSAGEVARRGAWEKADAPGVRGLAISDAWSRAVGPPARAVSRVARVDGDLLVIEVSDPAWMRNLRMLRSEILDRLNTELRPAGGAGRIRRLRFRTAQDPVVDPRPAPKPGIQGAGEERASGGSGQGRDKVGPGSGQADLEEQLAQVARRYLEARR